MPEFFRVIRRKLIKEGNLRRYLIYAAGEILLVMIGILLALKVNNLNQERINNNKEFLLIRALDSELAINQDYINGRINYLTDVVEAKGKQLINLTGPSVESVSNDTLSRLLLNAIYQAPYAPIISKYQHIMSSDENDLIRSDSLKQLLFEYQTKLDLASWQQFEMREEIIQYLHENYSTLHMLSNQDNRVFNNLKSEISSENLFPVDGNTILSDRKFQSMLVTRFEANAYTILLLKGVLRHINEMKSYIQEYYSI